MDSFEFFNSVCEDDGHTPRRSPLTKKEILWLFEQSHNKIDIFSGEMFMFNDVELTDQIDKILSEKENQIAISVACGDRIIGIPDEITKKPENPFLKMLEGKEKAQVNYNSMGLIEQIANGYIHSIVVDGGRYIYLEEPHSYAKYNEYDSSKDKAKNLLIETAYDLGLELIKRYEAYQNLDDVVINEYEIIKNNTYSAEEFFARAKSLDFNDREGFMELWEKQLDNLFKNTTINLEPLKDFASDLN